MQSHPRMRASRERIEAVTERTHVRSIAAIPEHAGDISALHARLFERGWNSEEVSRLLEHPACFAQIAVVQQEPHAIGYVLAQAAAGEAEILSIGVAERWRRQGVGRLLTEALVAEARRKGAHRLFLDVAETNAAALALYRQLGFTQLGRRKAYYLRDDGERDDALLMVLDL